MKEVSDMSNTEKTRENALRRKAKRLHFVIKKSRKRVTFPHDLDDYGEYMLIDLYQNIPVCGFKFSASLDEIDEYLLEVVKANASEA